MSNEFDPGAAAARALGQHVDSEPSAESVTEEIGATTDSAADTETGSTSESGASTTAEQLKSRALATEPNVPLEDDQLSIFDPENGGLRRMKRGFYKALNVPGATAIEDVIIGFGEVVFGSSSSGRNGSGDSDDGGGDQEDGDEIDVAALQGVDGV